MVPHLFTFSRFFQLAEAAVKHDESHDAPALRGPCRQYAGRFLVRDPEKKGKRQKEKGKSIAAAVIAGA